MALDINGQRGEIGAHVVALAVPGTWADRDTVRSWLR